MLRTVFAILSALVLIFLVACGGSSNSDDSKADQSVSADSGMDSTNDGGVDQAPLPDQIDPIDSGEDTTAGNDITGGEDVAPDSNQDLQTQSDGNDAGVQTDSGSDQSIPDDSQIDQSTDDLADTQTVADVSDTQAGDSESDQSVSDSQSDVMDSSSDTDDGNTTPDQQSATCVIRVDLTVGSSGDGSSWGQAYKTLTEGLVAASVAIASSAQITTCEVWVAKGVYYNPVAGNSAFLIPSGVQLFGGFNGSETTRDQRDWKSNQTTLSACDNATCASPHIRSVYIGSPKNNTGLDGFKIKDGTPDGGADHGAGIAIVFGASSPGPVFLRNLYISDNEASRTGGGLRAYNQSSTSATPLGQLNMDNVWFVNNHAMQRGGGMRLQRINATITDCHFIGNSTNTNASWHGGGVSIRDSKVTMRNSYIIGNKSYYGGGLNLEGWTLDSVSTFTNVVITGNWAKHGGGVEVDQHAELQQSFQPRFMNVTVARNIASLGGSSLYINRGTLQVVNTIVQHLPELANGGSLSANYSRIPNGTNTNVSTVPSNEFFYESGNGWKSYKYNPNTNQTEIDFNESFKWMKDGLKGKFFRVNIGTVTGDIVLSFPIVGNSTSVVTVLGDISKASQNDKFYGIYNLRPSKVSAMIDAGTDTNAPALDILGKTRVDTPGVGSSRKTDIGAYEYTGDRGNGTVCTSDDSCISGVCVRSGRIVIGQCGCGLTYFSSCPSNETCGSCNDNGICVCK